MHTRKGSTQAKYPRKYRNWNVYGFGRRVCVVIIKLYFSRRIGLSWGKFFVTKRNHFLAANFSHQHRRIVGENTSEFFTSARRFSCGRESEKFFFLLVGQRSISIHYDYDLALCVHEWRSTNWQVQKRGNLCGLFSYPNRRRMSIRLLQGFSWWPSPISNKLASEAVFSLPRPPQINRENSAWRRRGVKKLDNEHSIGE